MTGFIEALRKKPCEIRSLLRFKDGPSQGQGEGKHPVSSRRSNRIHIKKVALDMKKIAVEEHFLTEDYMDYLRSRKDYPKMEPLEGEAENGVEQILHSPIFRVRRTPRQISRLTDLGEGRLLEMDKTGIHMQVLSLAGPGPEAFDAVEGTALARKTNDALAHAIARNPERLAGFAAIAPQDPLGAADEIKRSIETLGLKGVKINSHVQGEYLDLPKYRPIFEMAHKLDVPIYLHPKGPPPDMAKPYMTYPRLTGAIWGFAADVGLLAMRLICSGVFDEYPRLKIVLGHLGEGLPFWIWRIDKSLRRTPLTDKVKKPVSEYIKNNFFVSTSGMFWHPALLFVCLALGADKILFAVDTPSESNQEAVEFIEQAPLSDGDKAKICHLNSEKLLKL